MPSSEPQFDTASRRSSLGLVTYCLNIWLRSLGELSPEERRFKLLARAKELGSSGIQMDCGIGDRAYIKKLRETAEQMGLSLEGIVSLPRADTDISRFEQQLSTVREAGISIARTVILSGRRYEEFNSYDAFKTAMAAGRKALERAEPVASRHKVKLALENHKDQRTDERVELLQALSSEFIGACFDVGNNIALLEDPVEVCRAFAPWILTVHFKDQAIREYNSGFLLADIVLGKGCIDLTQILQILHEKAPRARLHLELITRNALQVPTLADAFWQTLPDVPARELGSTLQLLRNKSSPEEFAAISNLPLADQVKIEQSNIEESLRFGAQQLKL